MHKVILSLGSNIEDRMQHLDFGLASIKKKIGNIIKVSSIYETDPLGFESNCRFYNLCVSIESILNPFEILNNIQNIELEAGRTHKSKNNIYQSRTLDIDIILMDNITLKSENLSIPHPHFSTRKFVLVPMNEICPDFIVANTNKTVAEFLNDCRDFSYIKRLDSATINNY